MRSFRASDLPAELQAPPVENTEKFDPTRFTPPQASNDLIEPGDVLRIALAAGLDRDANTTFYVRVGEDGAAMLPEIGAIALAGLGLVQAEQQITSTCVQRGIYRRPTVSVALERRPMNRVLVVGAVEKPGIHELPRRSSYLGSALVAAGGMTKEAGTKIEIRRLGTGTALASSGPAAPGAEGVQHASAVSGTSDRQVQVVCLNLADGSHQVRGAEYLDDGSVVTVEKRKFEPIQVLGLVLKPGEYDFPTDRETHLLRAIALAGGTSNRMADEILIVRHAPDGRGEVKIRASLRAAKQDLGENLRLAPGDIVSVEQTPITVLWDLANRFTIGGTVPILQ